MSPYNWKAVKNYENNQGYTARALELQLLFIIFSIPYLDINK